MAKAKNASAPAPVAAEPPPSAASTGTQMFLQAYSLELKVFGIVFVVLMMFSSQRFWRQSEAPHFVYQAKSYLEGRLDIPADVLPNLEDWACVREVNGVKQRCEGQPQQTDKWYSSFPTFPSIAMLPFVLIHGYQFNDTSFGVFIAALSIAFFLSFLRLLEDHEGLKRTPLEQAMIAGLLCFGTLFFYASIRGEVWFAAEVMGVGLTALYLRNSVGARRPLLAGLFWSMAVLTRTPLFFTGIFFALEAIAPTKGERMNELRAFFSGKAEAPKKKRTIEAIKRFVMGAAPLGVTAAIFNQVRFGKLTEFGHSFFFNNRVNADIDQYGLFHWKYLARDLDAAFLALPRFEGGLISYSPWGLSLFITLPLLAIAFVPATMQKRALGALAAMVAVLVGSALFPRLQGDNDVGNRAAAAIVLVLGTLALFAYFAWQWAQSEEAPRLLVPTLITLAVCALPGLFYQNTGYAQFGFRFSIDYMPYVILLVALGGWSFKKLFPATLAVLSVVASFWGAVAFRGYTEGMRRWP